MYTAKEYFISVKCCQDTEGILYESSLSSSLFFYHKNCYHFDDNDNLHYFHHNHHLFLALHRLNMTAITVIIIIPIIYFLLSLLNGKFATEIFICSDVMVKQINGFK